MHPRIFETSPPALRIKSKLLVYEASRSLGPTSLLLTSRPDFIWFLDGGMLEVPTSGPYPPLCTNSATYGSVTATSVTLVNSCHNWFHLKHSLLSPTLHSYSSLPATGLGSPYFSFSAYKITLHNSVIIGLIFVSIINCHLHKARVLSDLPTTVFLKPSSVPHKG